MHDRYGLESQKFRHICQIGSSVSELYGCQEISTPILEFLNVFDRTLGEESDIVNKELYSFKDRNDSMLVMRPEGTAGICRAVISNGLAHSTSQKLYYYGPMFRHERPQKGRLRQFEQFGTEYFGFGHPSSDIEVIEMGWRFLSKLGLDKNVEIHINSLGDVASRIKYREVLTSYLRENVEKLSSDSVRRLENNPLRVLDSKDPGDIEVVNSSPQILNYLNEESNKRFEFICSGLKQLNIPFKLNPQLVRGLDYYDHTVWEFKCSNEKLGTSQGTILAGGRYDNLVEKMGGPKNVPGIGWAAGIERLSLLLEDSLLEQEKRPIAIVLARSEAGDSSVAPQATVSELAYYAHHVAGLLRGRGEKVLLIHPNSDILQPVSKALTKALKSNARQVVFIGEHEFQNNQVTVRNTDLREQQTCTLEEYISRTSTDS
ncbi:histidyl-tRNA synthetase [Basidiobolus meristosporus CBS 931.73]|uniref:histidine--tRNA ligase n=1 Tax=Basidiobolus meristosporus CBS 931.73 TaxID=1314790 RepID=A0A1Y1Z1E3_9FUNG|nr:histidyl-tRNA synthetase [Basidiobolus meristosporus CBS 931.73]|eukprot:ORY04100.1 histidyl-tRNA synthetase [Basidiobolus meristosporus CBS 931.73]